MCIFKDITNRYCEKILDTYQLQADEKTYKGKEAELLIQRNDFARCLVKTIKTIEVKDNDYIDYFKKITNEINSSLKEVANAVTEYNIEFSTVFTVDLYENFHISLISFINTLSDLYQKSPSIISHTDESLFNNNRNVPWVYQFSFVLYEYILEKEFDIVINKIDRDIFDTKKQFILKYIQKAASIYSSYQNENDAEYKELMKVLLQSMRSEEQDIQRRKSEDNNTNNMYSYFTQSLYKASEKLMGKNQLGQKIDFLIREFNERTVTKGLIFG